jgi:hypothetical protein
LVALEERALLNAAMPHHKPDLNVPRHVHAQGHHSHGMNQSGGPAITVNSTPRFKGFHFTNFDGPMAGTNAGAGTNLNGISNTGTAVGFTIDNNGNFLNFTVDPRKTRAVTLLNINGATNAMAFGTNSRGSVVGSDGRGNAFVLSHGMLSSFIPNGGTSATAFGINDHNEIVGQYLTGNATPGFIKLNENSIITVNAPSGPDVVNVQGMSNKGLAVGFYLGTDGQVHGFMAQKGAAQNGVVRATAIADPSIPSVAGEPGATFVFSQVLAVNDHGIAVGYYGDSTTSQHGFFYNTNTGQYTFLDDPSEAFNNGVEVTQITGITNSGEISGFYSDANGVFHGFVANPPRS